MVAKVEQAAGPAETVGQVHLRHNSVHTQNTLPFRRGREVV